MTLRPTPPQPITATDSPGCTLAVLSDGAETGDDSASEDARQLHRDVGVDRRDGSLVEQDVVGQRADVGHLPDADTVERQARPVALRPLRDARIQARRRLAGDAADALAAAHHQARHHVIADLDVAHVGADSLDDAGALVAEDHGTRTVQRAVEVVVVAVAQAGRDRPHQDLATDRLVVLDIGDGELVGIVEEYGSAHCAERRRDYFAARRWRGSEYAPAASALVS